MKLQDTIRIIRSVKFLSDTKNLFAPLFAEQNPRESFKRFSSFTLVFTLGVILWGAYVRFSHSGDACGSDWPLCRGKLIPDSLPALTEWIHRATSGLSLLLVLGLALCALKVYPPKHIVRKFALSTGVFILIEALIGAVLVLASLTGSDDSGLRVTVLNLHLINSLLLTGGLVLCRQGALGGRAFIKKPFIYFVAVFPLLALTGSVASLAGTLFPSESLSQAFISDFLPDSHITLKLRPLHPLLALGFVLWIFLSAEGKKLFIGISSAAFLSGLITLLTLSPVPMKLIHLSAGYALWIFLVKSAFLFTSSSDGGGQKY